MKNKIKYIMPILATAGFVPCIAMTVTSCSQAITLENFLTQYEKFLNNYKTNQYKDLRYVTADLGTKLSVNLKVKDKAVEIKTIDYNPLDDVSELVTENDSYPFTVQPIEYATQQLKVLEIQSDSHEYKISDDEISAVYKDKDNKLIGSFVYNKNGFLTHSVTTDSEITITYNSAPTAAKYTDLDKFIIKYKELYQTYLSGLMCYKTEDIGNGINGTYTEEGSAAVPLKSLKNTGVDETGTFDDGITTSQDKIITITSITPETFYGQLKYQYTQADEHTFFLEGDVIGFEFKKSSRVVYSYKFNKNGYITNSVTLNWDDKQITIAMTYSKDPSHPKWE